MSSYSDGNFYNANTRLNPFLVECVSDVKPGISIDFGCGIGTNSHYLQQNGWDVYLIDREEIAIKALSNRFDSNKVFQNDITNMDFSKLPMCNLVLCNYVLQHLPVQCAYSFINNAISKLQPLGYLVVSIFERENAISFSELDNHLKSLNGILIKKKSWCRLDSDHGPVHFHSGIECFWRFRKDDCTIKKVINNNVD